MESTYILNLAGVLTQNYPDDNWALENDDYSTLVWMSETDKPTFERLKGLAGGDQRQCKLEEVRAGAKEQIEIIAGYPQWYQNNVANGLYPSATGDAMTAYIASVITESNRCEDLVTDAETLDEALAVTPDWPEV
jgi:hypothetical protein